MDNRFKEDDERLPAYDENLEGVALNLSMRKKEGGVDKILVREFVPRYIKMSSRNLSRLLASHMIPFIRTHFLLDINYGKIYFSRNKLDAWLADDEDVNAMTGVERVNWQLKNRARILGEKKEESVEMVIALRIKYLSKMMLKTINSGGSLDVAFDRRATEYAEKIRELDKIEKGRLVDFFDGDMECLLFHFPGLFKVEMKALKEEAEAREFKREDYPTEPGTLKPREENIQVTQEVVSEVTRFPEAVKKEE